MTLAFLDESGFSLNTTLTRTWAPKGQTPTVPSWASWDKLSTIGTITTNGQFLQHTQLGSITATAVVVFLKHVLAHVQGDVVVILDHARIHTARMVQTFVDAHPRLSLVFLPTYAPELNPIEPLWAYVKQQLLGDFCPRDLADLKRRLRSTWQRVRAIDLPARLLHTDLPSPT